MKTDIHSIKLDALENSGLNRSLSSTWRCAAVPEAVDPEVEIGPRPGGGRLGRHGTGAAETSHGQELRRRAARPTLRPLDSQSPPRGSGHLSRSQSTGALTFHSVFPGFHWVTPFTLVCSTLPFFGGLLFHEVTAGFGFSWIGID